MLLHRYLGRAVRPLLALTLIAGLAAPALAHGPTRQKVVEKVTIDAPAAAVWGRIRNFDALKDWHPAVAESPADKGNEVGSVRQLKLKGGGELTESLESFSDEQMKYTYRAEGSKAVVEWRGAFYRAFPNNNPPPDQNDEAAVAAITGVYQSGLANLKKLAEGK
jgi:hypothetical protein